MPKKVVQRFKAWSYSRWRQYETCPAQANWRHLDKQPVKEEESPALARGSEVHAEAHRFVTQGGKLPKSLDAFEAEFGILRRAHQSGETEVFTEEQWALTSSWSATDWFGSDVWVRAVLDSMLYDPKRKKAMIIDYKTGKVRKEEQQPQLELYAAVALSKIESLERITSSLWYIDHGQSAQLSYVRTDLPMLHRLWENRVRKMMNDELFKPRPGDHCRWCPFAKAKGGPCPH